MHCNIVSRPKCGPHATSTTYSTCTVVQYRYGIYFRIYPRVSLWLLFGRCAPTHVTCGLWCSGGREGLNSRSPGISLVARRWRGFPSSEAFSVPYLFLGKKTKMGIHVLLPPLKSYSYSYQYLRLVAGSAAMASRRSIHLRRRRVSVRAARRARTAARTVVVLGRSASGSSTSRRTLT